MFLNIDNRDNFFAFDYNSRKTSNYLKDTGMNIKHLPAALAVSLLSLSAAYADDAAQDISTQKSPPAEWLKEQQEIKNDPGITFFGMSPQRQAEIMKQTGSFHPVQFHKAETSREWKLVSGFYGKYINQHKDIQLESAVLDLNGGKIGSILVRFVSNGTCVNDSCLTNIVSFTSPGDGVLGAREDRSWHEVWSRHTSTLYVGPPSPTLKDGSDGQNMSEIMGDDHVLWRWMGPPYSYYPEILSTGSVAYPWRRMNSRDDSLRDAVHNDFPAFYSPGDNEKNKAIYTTLLDNKNQQIVAVQYMGTSACGQVGCPMTIYMKNKNTSVDKWTNISGPIPININDSAITRISLSTLLPTKKSSLPSFAVKDANFISLWGYGGGQYHRYAQITPVLPQEN